MSKTMTMWRKNNHSSHLFVGVSSRHKRKVKYMASSSPQTEIVATASAPIVTYSDEELRVIVRRPEPKEKEDTFVFDFDKLWPALGYATKGNAVRALDQSKQGLFLTTLYYLLISYLID
jgi:hypothetical protein